MKYPKSFAAVLAAAPLFAQQVIERPKILWVAHMAVYVKDLAKTRQFYEDFLGFGEPFTLPNKGGGGVRIAFIKVNDHQYFEIFNEKDRGEGQLNHISFYADKVLYRQSRPDVRLSRLQRRASAGQSRQGSDQEQEYQHQGPGRPRR
jgi:catechol 2,3-dioxygenase-like lactoylglutathione lyase family enzyme